VSTHITRDHLDAVCARYLGEDEWALVPPAGRFGVREQILSVLSAAVAEGWNPPVIEDSFDLEAAQGEDDHGSGDPELADDIAAAVAKHWDGEAE
jgi:hypothetical protein